MATIREAAKRPMTATSAVGSTVALATLEGEDLVLILDEDASAIRVADATTLKERTHLALAGQPAQLVVAADGRAYVALRDRNQVVALEVKPDGPLALIEAGAVDVATEPVALATDPSGQTLLVTSGWGARLASYDVKTHARGIDVALGREPRGVAVSSDGQVAHVAHMVGSRITRVSLADGGATEITLGGSDFTPIPPPPPTSCFFPIHFEPARDFRSGMGSHNVFERDAVQGFAVAVIDDRVFVPEVLVHRGEAATVSGSYGGTSTSSSFPAHQPTLVVVDGDDTTLRVPYQTVKADKSRYDVAGAPRRDGCFLPRAAAADPTSKTVLVSCLGGDEVRVIDTKENNSLTAGTRARWKVPSGPSGIAVDQKRKRALVWSQFARKLAAIPLAEPIPEEDKPKRGGIPKVPAQQMAPTIAAFGPIEGEQLTLSAKARKGRAFFHGAGDRRISRDGRACASCHPDGREDGLAWSTPFGTRQTPMLAGRLQDELAPFGWHGDADTVAGHLKQTFKRLGGTGLTADELDALITYCHEMSTPPKLPAGDPTLVAKGKELFHADTVGCASCHKEGDGSDGNRHEVGSGPKLDTPSLRFVAGTAPYFHDGRYKTLAELLEHSQGTMGWGNGMSQRDFQALEAYLRTL